MSDKLKELKERSQKRKKLLAQTVSRAMILLGSLMYNNLNYIFV